MAFTRPFSKLISSVYFLVMILGRVHVLPLPNHHAQINSNSVLLSLIDSADFTEFAEWIEKAFLFQELEGLVSKDNITIFAPVNSALDRDIDPEFKRFLLEPGNFRTLQVLLLSHMVRGQIGLEDWPVTPTETTYKKAVSGEKVVLSRSRSGVRLVGTGTTNVLNLQEVHGSDGVICGISGLVVPSIVQQSFNSQIKNLGSVLAMKPEGAPMLDPRTIRNRKLISSEKQVDSMQVTPDPEPLKATESAAMASISSYELNARAQVKNLIETLINYGGYNEIADILVNLTSLANEMGRLVSEGYALTILAPNDEAMSRLTMEQLKDPSAPERIVYYHMVPEYQTEESMYNAVRRFRKVVYDTLLVPHKLVAQEADGTVRLGQGNETAYLFDPDVYADGRVSVQGIDTVLFPPLEQ